MSGSTSSASGIAHQNICPIPFPEKEFGQGPLLKFVSWRLAALIVSTDANIESLFAITYSRPYQV